MWRPLLASSSAVDSRIDLGQSEMGDIVGQRANGRRRTGVLCLAPRPVLSHPLKRLHCGGAAGSSAHPMQVQLAQRVAGADAAPLGGGGELGVGGAKVAALRVP